MLEEQGHRPSIYTGTSVGAINAVSLVATHHLPAATAVSRALDRWHDVDRGAVIRSALSRLPLTLIRGAGQMLSLPGIRLPSLLDPAPLVDNLRHWIDWKQLHRNIFEASECVASVIATSAYTGRAVAFVEGHPGRKLPRSHVIDYVPARLGETHVQASAAIPLLFPPVRVEQPPDATGWYVDGAARLNTPIKPAIDLGAERLIVIATGSLTQPPQRPGRYDAPAPDLTSAAVHLLHGALADPLLEDMRRLAEVNVFYSDSSSSPAAARERRMHGKPPYRAIPYIFVAPRTHHAIANLASDIFHARYDGLKGLRSPDFAVLGRLLGGDGRAHGELLSYLLFDREFISELMAMGARDARAWLDAPPGREEPWQLEPLDVLVEAEPPRRKPSKRVSQARSAESRSLGGDDQDV